MKKLAFLVVVMFLLSACDKEPETIKVVVECCCCEQQAPDSCDVPEDVQEGTVGQEDADEQDAVNEQDTVGQEDADEQDAVNEQDTVGQ